jgi:hypothetical protein
MCMGIILHSATDGSLGSKYVLSFGLFSFAGGITNWLAIKMLFDKIPLLYGSGVIPRQFKAIRETIKTTIMNTFFDSNYLETYLNDRAKGFLADVDVGSRIKKGMELPSFEVKLVAKLQELSEKPDGMLLQTMAGMFGGIEPLVPFVKPLIIGLADEFANSLVENFDIKDYISVDKIRGELDSLMTKKLELLTPEIVKVLIEDVIKE